MLNKCLLNNLKRQANLRASFLQRALVQGQSVRSFSQVTTAERILAKYAQEIEAG